MRFRGLDDANIYATLVPATWIRSSSFGYDELPNFQSDDFSLSIGAMFRSLWIVSQNGRYLIIMLYA